MSAKLFYVYEHWRTDRDECFYVGKGKGNRAYNLKSRNKHHKAIMAKLSREGFAMEVRIVQSGLSEQDAFLLEIERINFWRESGVDLANMTNGGEGASGLVAYNKKSVTCLNDGNIFESLNDASKFYKICISEISSVCNEKYRYIHDLYFIFGDKILTEIERKNLILEIEKKHAKRRKKTKENKSYPSLKNGKDQKGRLANGPIKSSRSVICLEENKNFCSASEAARYYNISKSAIIELCLGKNNRKSVGGYKFKYVEAL
jgi:hypothetical protein